MFKRCHQCCPAILQTNQLYICNFSCLCIFSFILLIVQEVLPMLSCYLPDKPILDEFSHAFFQTGSSVCSHKSLVTSFFVAKLYHPSGIFICLIFVLYLFHICFVFISYLFHVFSYFLYLCQPSFIFPNWELCSQFSFHLHFHQFIWYFWAFYMLNICFTFVLFLFQIGFIFLLKSVFSCPGSFIPTLGLSAGVILNRIKGLGKPVPSKTDEFSEKFRRGGGDHFQSKN